MPRIRDEELVLLKTELTCNAMKHKFLGLTDAVGIEVRTSSHTSSEWHLKKPDKYVRMTIDIEAGAGTRAYWLKCVMKGEGIDS